jgi:hypothetical protein
MTHQSQRTRLERKPLVEAIVVDEVDHVEEEAVDVDVADQEVEDVVAVEEEVSKRTQLWKTIMSLEHWILSSAENQAIARTITKCDTLSNQMKNTAVHEYLAKFQHSHYGV